MLRYVQQAKQVISTRQLRSSQRQPLLEWSKTEEDRGNRGQENIYARRLTYVTSTLLLQYYVGDQHDF